MTSVTVSVYLNEDIIASLCSAFQLNTLQKRRLRRRLKHAEVPASGRFWDGNGSATMITKRLNKVAAKLSRINCSGYAGYMTIFSWMLTTQCCLLVALRVELGLARVRVRFSVWLVSGYTHVSVLLCDVILTLPIVTIWLLAFYFLTFTSFGENTMRTSLVNSAYPSLSGSARCVLTVVSAITAWRRNGEFCVPAEPITSTNRILV